MKKNRMMRLASGLLVAVLLTTSVISGTFAKYVTTDQASDTARVAKWGVAVSVNGNLFGTDYAANDAQANANSIIATSTNVSSAANTKDNVVAPGTKNDVGLKIALTGTPEVAYTISASNNEVEAEEIFLAAGKWGVMVPAYGLNDDTNFSINTYYTLTQGSTNYTKASGFTSDTNYYELVDEVTVSEGGYYPMDWTVEYSKATSGAFDFTEMTETRLDKIQEAMIGKLAQNSKVIDANTDATGYYVLKWKWDFEDNNTNNGADTILGNLMAANTDAVVVKMTDNDEAYTSQLTDGTDYNLENKFGISITVTQVD